jgi:hypothetical protein
MLEISHWDDHISEEGGFLTDTPNTLAVKVCSLLLRFVKVGDVRPVTH